MSFQWFSYEICQSLRTEVYIYLFIYLNMSVTSTGKQEVLQSGLLNEKVLKNRSMVDG